MPTDKKLIWDLPLRLFHWLFALSIFAAWYTSEQEGEMVEQHMLLGYFILGLVIFRILWGFVGTKHARFSEFFPTPAKISAYVKALKSGEQLRYAGHNPLGSLMVLLMILLILLQAVSGLFINDDIFSEGPYYGVLGAELQQAMEFIHHNVFDVMIYAIGLHIFAVLYYRLKKKIDLITPMITGKKPSDSVTSSDAISGSRILVALVVAAAVAAFVYWLVVVNAPVEEAYFY